MRRTQILRSPVAELETDLDGLCARRSRVGRERHAGQANGHRRHRKQRGSLRNETVDIRPKGAAAQHGVLQVVGPREATVYTAGQVSIDERGELVGGGDLAAQTAQAMRNVGLAWLLPVRDADVVKITTYVVTYRPEHEPSSAKRVRPSLRPRSLRRALLSASAQRSMGALLSRLRIARVPPVRSRRGSHDRRLDDAPGDLRPAREGWTVRREHWLAIADAANIAEQSFSHRLLWRERRPGTTHLRKRGDTIGHPASAMKVSANGAMFGRSMMVARRPGPSDSRRSRQGRSRRPISSRMRTVRRRAVAPV